jgi:O-methyltransferase involved in polyketide biosynthesis
MPAQQLRLDPVQETLLLTLYARALDSGAPTSILGDTLAAAVADRIAEDPGSDFARLGLKPSLVASTALRARKLDDVVHHRHPAVCPRRSVMPAWQPPAQSSMDSPCPVPGVSGVHGW